MSGNNAPRYTTESGLVLSVVFILLVTPIASTSQVYENSELVPDDYYLYHVVECENSCYFVATISSHSYGNIEHHILVGSRNTLCEYHEYIVSGSAVITGNGKNHTIRGILEPGEYFFMLENTDCGTVSSVSTGAIVQATVRICETQRDGLILDAVAFGKCNIIQIGDRIIPDSE